MFGSHHHYGPPQRPRIPLWLPPTLLLILFALRPTLRCSEARAQAYTLTPEHFGGAPGATDAAPAVAQALEALAAWHDQHPEGQPVLEFGPGLWTLENLENRKAAVMVRQVLTVRCDSDAILQGDLTPGDHLVPPEDWTSKRLFWVEANATTGDLSFSMETCTLALGRPRAANEQASALFIQGLDGAWVRGIDIRDVTCTVIGSGDCVYLGRYTEGVTLRDVHCTDCARNGISVAGIAGPTHRRTGFDFRGLSANWTHDRPGESHGNVVDFEPPAAGKDDRLYDVNIEGVYAPTGSMDIVQVVHATLRDFHVTKVSTEKLLHLDADGGTMDCRPGAWGDGAGACWYHARPPSVFTVKNVVARVHPDGAGVLALRDYTADTSSPPHEQLYDVSMYGRVQFNGPVDERDVADSPGFYSDRLRVLTGFTVVPDPAVP